MHSSSRATACCPRTRPVSRRADALYGSRVLVARSSPECHLYIELHPCACGEHVLETRHRLVSLEDGLGAVYEGTCARCGTARRFEFVLDPEIPPGDKFGGLQPSAILDAGQYLAVADDASKRVPADVSGLDEAQRRTARWWMNRAVNALEEVIKAIPAGDAVLRVRCSASWGKAMHAHRFRRLRLEAVLQLYRDILDRADS